MEYTGSKPSAASTAGLVALACVLQVSESLIPHPVPGVRLGLANLVGLTALCVYGLRYALEIAVLRALLSSIALGTFLSPTFVLSFSGAVTSTLAMGALLRLSSWRRAPAFSVIGLSVGGAAAHSMTQIVLAYLLLIKHTGIFVFVPILGVSAAATGCLNGAIAAGVLRRLRGKTLAADSPGAGDCAEPIGTPDTTDPAGLLSGIPARLKIGLATGFCALAMFLDSLWLTGSLLGVLVSITVLGAVPLGRLLRRVRRLASLIVMAFAFPAIFHGGAAGNEAWLSGIATGALYASRIVALVFASGLLIETTTPRSLAEGLGAFLAPLRLLGISSQRSGQVMSMALDAMPAVGRSAKQAIAEAGLARPRGLRRLIPMLSDLVAGLYLDAEPREGSEPAPRPEAPG